MAAFAKFIDLDENSDLESEFDADNSSFPPSPYSSLRNATTTTAETDATTAPKTAAATASTAFTTPKSLTKKSVLNVPPLASLSDVPPRRDAFDELAKPWADLEKKWGLKPERERKATAAQPSSTPKASVAPKTKPASKPSPAPRPSAARRPPPPKMDLVSLASLVDDLNDAQRRAVTSKSDTVAILAGPGSGKTHTLTSRVAWLIDAVGYAPYNVIVATFTVKAAREMKERIGRLLGPARAKRIVLGTFHSVALRYLSTYGTRIGLASGFGIADDSDSRAILKRIIKQLNYDLDPGMARGWISKKKAKGCLRAEEGEINKERPRPPQPAPAFGIRSKNDTEQRLEAVFGEYQKHLASLNLLDYDDLLVRCTELLRAHSACVSNVQAVLIDEYQDTNGVQFELMKLLAQARGRITVVGDPDQSIYGWRSAEVTNLSRFLHDFPRTAEISLEENYRSSQCILNTSLQIIRQDRERYDKSLLPIHKKGTLPVLRRLADSAAEARWIVQEIQRVGRLSGHMLNHGDVAILLRSAFLSRPIEQALAKAAIPYRMIGGRKFFERAEIKVLVDYLRVINHPSHNEALLRIINVPKRGIGAVTLSKCGEEAERNGLSLWALISKHCHGEIKLEVDLSRVTKKLLPFVQLIEAMRRRLEGTGSSIGGDNNEEDAEDAKDDPSATTVAKMHNLIQLIEALIEQLNYRNYIGEEFGAEDEARWGNVDEFLTLASEFMNNAPQLLQEDELPCIAGVEQTNTPDVLDKFLANIALSADADKDKGDGDGGDGQKKPMVTISTIHAAKGLEWPVVFIPGAYDGSLPHSRAEDTGEERRLLYVAMTRAQCLLSISFPVFGHQPGYGTSSGDGDEQALSRFLEPVAEAWFAERGPAYDRALLEEMGDILGRPVPSNEAIYGSLPPGALLDDSVYPLDPAEERRLRDDDEESYRPRTGGVVQSSKRRRLAADTTAYTPATGTAGGGSSAGPWPWSYKTTMDAAASYPGFTAASTYQPALPEEAEAQGSADSGAKRKRGPLPAGQQTIMQSFVRSNSSTTTAHEDAVPKDETGLPAQRPLNTAFQRPHGIFSVQQQQQQQPGRASLPAGSIAPELTGRSIGGVRANMMPTAGGDSRRGVADAMAAPRPYAHFSSSPTRPLVAAETTPGLHVPAAAPLPPPETAPDPNAVLPRFHHHHLPAGSSSHRGPTYGLPRNLGRLRPLQPRQSPASRVNTTHRQPAGRGKENIAPAAARTGVKPNVKPDVKPAVAAQPAATFHSTTIGNVHGRGTGMQDRKPQVGTAARNGDGGYKGYGGYSGYGGYGGYASGGGVPDALRKPFKPPTIRRPVE